MASTQNEAYSLPVIHEKKHVNENINELQNKIKILTKKVDTQNDQLSSMIWTYVIPNRCDFYYINKSEHYDTETQYKIGPYTIQQLCGVGKFASVKKCKKDDKEMAIKIITKKSVTSISGALRIENEIQALHILKSQYITNIYDTFTTATLLGVVIELGTQDLYSYIDNFPTGIDETIAKKIALNIIDAVNHCHKKGVYHMDIKPENILIDETTYDIKLCDFGLCAFENQGTLSDFVGSPGFFAPEMFLQSEYKGDKADIWSIGSVILEMILGHDRFYKYWLSSYDPDVLQNRESFLKKMVIAITNLDILHKKYHYSRELIEFFKTIYIIHPDHRSSIDILYEHSWLLQENTPSCSFFMDSIDNICPPIQPPHSCNENKFRHRFIKF